MRNILFTLIFLSVTTTAFSHEFERGLRHFNKIVASPRINVILQKGNSEHIRLVYNDVHESEINIIVRGKKLFIFLENARKIEPSVRNGAGEPRRGIYESASITAYVTYRDLEGVEIRGNQELTCNGPIESEVFTLRAYGENDITLASLNTEFFKAALYGENKLKIRDGKVLDQRYRLYGENKIDTREMKSTYTSTTIFGEGKLKVSSSEEVRVNAFGEPKIFVDGGAHVNRRLIIGRTKIVRQ
jgi:hypothetical protein